MAFNAVASLDVGRGSLAGIVAHNRVTEGQSSGAQGSNSTEEQKSGTEVKKFTWKPDEQKSEWIRNLESGLDAPGCYIPGDQVVVMKLPDFMRKPEEDYTPQQWLFGLHNRNLQTSTTVASTRESEDLKIRLAAAACNLKSDRRDKVCDNQPDEVSDNRRDEACDNRWNEFCDNVVHNPDEMVLKSYGLHPSNTTKFSKKEVQSLLTLDALTLFLVLISWPPWLSGPFPQEKLLVYFIHWLEGERSKITPLLNCRVEYKALLNDLFLSENQIPMDLLKNVISKCYLLRKGQNSDSDFFQKLRDPQSSLTTELLQKILRNVALRMCIEIFVEPISDQNPLSYSIDDYPVGGLEDCEHIFACVYEILTTFHIKEESSTTIIGVYIFAFVYKILATFHIKKESASDREQLPHATNFGNSRTVLDIRETSPIGLEQPDDCQSRMSRILECIAPGAPTVEKQLSCPQIRTVKEGNLGEERLGSATDLKKAGLRIKPTPGMIKAVAFEKGCLFLPILQLHEKTASYFRNLAMYEVYGHHGKKRTAFSDYLQLMLELIKTQEDMAYLIDDCKVIRSSLITHQNAFKTWAMLQSGIDLSRTYSEKFITDIVIPVNRQQRKLKTKLNQMRTEFYDRYCSKPWLAISVITAVVLLLATLIQTYVLVIGSDKMQPHFPRGG